VYAHHGRVHAHPPLPVTEHDQPPHTATGSPPEHRKRHRRPLGDCRRPLLPVARTGPSFEHASHGGRRQLLPSAELPQAKLPTLGSLGIHAVILAAMYWRDVVRERRSIHRSGRGSWPVRKPAPAGMMFRGSGKSSWPAGPGAVNYQVWHCWHRILAEGRTPVRQELSC
jgi:hypothetical protein